jgi:hypothetical protein
MSRRGESRFDRNGVFVVPLIANAIFETTLLERRQRRDPLRPSFGDEQFGLFGRELERVASAMRRQIDTVDPFCEPTR